jgi:hypothetical protein
MEQGVESPMLTVASESELDRVLDEVVEAYEGMEQINGLVMRLRRELDRSQEHMEIDFG